MSTLLQDTFTDTDAVALTAHVGESGGWALASGTIDAEIRGNKVRYLGTSGGSTSRLVMATAPTQAEYDVELDITLLSAVGALGCVARHGSANTTGYQARYNAAGGQWELYYNTTLLGSWTDAATWIGSSKHLLFQVRNATKKVFVDGVERISSSDNTVATAGRVGFRMDGAITATTGLQADNFLVSTPPVAPTNTAAPAVTGSSVVGQTLTCSTGTWNGTPTSYAYQWRNNGVAITGATASTYVVQNADIGQAITCTVTATNAAGSTSQASNSVTGQDTAPAPVNTAAPHVTSVGAATTGHVLTCDTGTWTGSPTSYTRQWQRDGAAISGQTSSSYTLAVADEGHVVRCMITAINAQGSGNAPSNAINATANVSPTGTQTDLIYQGTPGATGSIAVTVVNVTTAAITVAKTTSGILEISPGVYRARCVLPAGRYIAVFEDGITVAVRQVSNDSGSVAAPAGQTDIVYHASAAGLTTVNATIINLADGTTTSPRSTAAVTEITPGIYRARRTLSAGRYLALFDEGNPANPTTVGIVV